MRSGEGQGRALAPLSAVEGLRNGFNERGPTASRRTLVLAGQVGVVLGKHRRPRVTVPPRRSSGIHRFMHGLPRFFPRSMLLRAPPITVLVPKQACPPRSDGVEKG